MNDNLSEWSEANQRYLLAKLAELKALVERYSGHRQEDTDITSNRVSESLKGENTHTDMPVPPAIDTLCNIFRLSSFERKILLLCAGIELEGSFALLCADVQDDPRRAYPTFSLALAAFPDAHWSALTPAGPLRYWRLIDVGSGSSLTTSPLRINERILHYLAGVSHMDERLMGMSEPVVPPRSIVPSHGRIVDLIVQTWSCIPQTTVLPLIQLCGPEIADKLDIAAVACARLGLSLNMVFTESLTVTLGEIESLIRLWEREAMLGASALLLECHDMETHDMARSAIRMMVERMRGALFLITRERESRIQRPQIIIDVARPPLSEQRELWMSMGKTISNGPDGRIDVLVSQFDLSSRTIQEAHAVLSGNVSPSDDIGVALWEACRVLTRPRLDHLAQRIEPVATWDDLVLPEQQQRVLREIVLHVRQRARVYNAWGFAAKSSRGLGISALFEGMSGTGKTMAAEVLANELRLDLYRIDLSQVVSKYIGETEKNLRQVFDAADTGGVILLFDEADALYGKRSEIKDSHDRYANIEVSYLLQRMEAYRGLAILTTNMKSALDTAFLRRIRFIVQFPFPDASYRAEIWKRIFPGQTPTEGLDISKLARLNITGGSIRNIALNAAFLAAGDNDSVRMVHVLSAARSEYAKLEKPLGAAEVSGWA